MSQAHNVYDYGSTGIPVPSTISGKNVNESYLAWKNFSPITLSNVTATQLPNCACGQVKILNLLGNDVIYVGGQTGTNDTPYLIPGNPGLGRGTPIYPGNSAIFQVVNANLLTVIASRNGDIISAQYMLSMKDFVTPTSDPSPNPATLPPLTVTSTIPVNGATGVLVGQVVEIIFSRNIKASSLNQNNVTISPAVPLSTVYVDPMHPNQVDLDPRTTGLSIGVSYTVTVNSGAGGGPTDNFGIGLGAPFTFSFMATGPPTPNVVTVSPGSNQTGVAITTKVTILMNTAVNPTQVTTSNIKLIKDSDSSTVTSTVSLSADQKTITITPTSNLLFSNVYYVTVQNLMNIIGVQESPNPWNGKTVGPNAGLFTTTSVGAPPTPTVTSVSPGNNQTGVSISTSTITIVMNTAVGSAQVTTSNILLINQTTGLSVSTTSAHLGVDNVTITLTLSGSLVNNTVYYAEVQNLQNTNFVTQSPNPWYGDSRNSNLGLFTTIQAPPTVSTVTPGSNSGGVAVSTNVVVVMTEQVKSAGVTTSNVKLINQSDGSTVPATVSLGLDNETITINPNSNLLFTTTYYVVVQNLQNLQSVTQTPNPWYGDSRNSNAGLFTTTAASFTQRYNISQAGCNSNYSNNDCTGDSFGPTTSSEDCFGIECCGHAGGLGDGSGQFQSCCNQNGGGWQQVGDSYGEIASVANGLTAAPITKVVIAQLAGDATNFQNASTSVPTGTFGVKIVNSSGVTQYTFGATFVASSTGYSDICSGIQGWSNITLTDTNNVYTMAVGDAIVITWNGTGNNSALVSQSVSNTYGKAVVLNGSSFITQGGKDLAATLYSSP